MKPKNSISCALLIAVFFTCGPAFSQKHASDASIYASTNLAAWCIVLFDFKKRGPWEHAQLLHKLEITKLAYDWRAEHIPTFKRN